MYTDLCDDPEGSNEIKYLKSDQCLAALCYFYAIKVELHCWVFISFSGKKKRILRDVQPSGGSGKFIKGPYGDIGNSSSSSEGMMKLSSQ